MHSKDKETNKNNQHDKNHIFDIKHISLFCS